MRTTTTSSAKLPIKVAQFNDVHLGHRRTLTIDTIAGFNRILKDEQEIASWDIVFFTGDLFDHLLFLTNSYLDEILFFLSRFLHLCRKHDVIVRFLEGTPAHDHKQTRLTRILADIIELVTQDQSKPIDVKHVTDLSIEYIEKLGIHVMYVPDEWHLDPIDTYNEAVQLMNDRGLEQVDFCLLHGAFNYQIDETLNPKSHPEELWCKLVRYYLFSGHVHFPSQYENILVCGSFNRLAHGEEHPKGWLTCEIKASGEHEILFHENTLATIYKTIDVRGKSPDDVMEIVKQTCEHYPPRSHIRLFVLDRDAINDGLKALRQLYSYFHFTVKVDVKEKQQRTLKIVNTKFEAITLDQDNIRRLLVERINALPNINNQQVVSILDKYL